MGTGKLSDESLEFMLRACRDVGGDYAEIGVWRGDTFHRIAKAAKSRGVVAHAFDSFRGLAAPVVKLDGKRYRRGYFDVGGVEAFVELLEEHETPADSYRTWPGYIPDCFEGCDARLALCFVDVDHYIPTKQSIAWAWPRLNAGGVIAFDDYFPGREILASPPIDEFVEKNRDQFEDITPDFVRENNQLLLVKR